MYTLVIQSMQAQLYVMVILGSEIFHSLNGSGYFILLKGFLTHSFCISWNPVNSFGLPSVFSVGFLREVGGIVLIINLDTQVLIYLKAGLHLLA